MATTIYYLRRGLLGICFFVYFRYNAGNVHFDSDGSDDYDDAIRVGYYDVYMTRKQSELIFGSSSIEEVTETLLKKLSK